MACLRCGETQVSVAQRFKADRRTVQRWVILVATTGSVAPRTNKIRKPKKLNPEAQLLLGATENIVRCLQRNARTYFAAVAGTTLRRKTVKNGLIMLSPSLLHASAAVCHPNISMR
ncbi:MAG: hypothetical protein LBC42_01940 [Puniceicoccales bacterium]|nr:hypothetical protein [Puniceicoccales bacterium]